MNFLLPGHPGGGLHPPSWPQGLPASFWRLLSAPQQTSSPVLSDLRTLISERFLKPPSPTQSKTLAGDARALSSHLRRVDFGVSGRGRAANSGPLRGSPNGCQINPWGGFWPGPGSFLCPNLSSVLLTSERTNRTCGGPGVACTDALKRSLCGWTASHPHSGDLEMAQAGRVSKFSSLPSTWEFHSSHFHK